MAWPSKVKENLLVACGRFCCVCGEHCGRNIEIDHIIPEAKGGPSTEDNGIPVCFNCHADIKHYNDSHPRGTKFRPDELRRLRERMFYLVASGKIYLTRGLRESAAVPERAPDTWKKSQASTICSYEFPFFPPMHEGKADAAVVGQLFERIQQIIALAYCVTAATTPFDDFVYILSVEEIDLPAHASTVIRTEIHCHLTKFVEVFQAKCEREFQQKDVELPPELESVPDGIELEMSAIPGPLVPYRISRTGPKSVWLRDLINLPNQCPPVRTTSGLLALLHGVLTNKTIIWDDFSWTEETTKVMGFMFAVADGGGFSFSQIKLNRDDPEQWEGPSVER